MSESLAAFFRRVTNHEILPYQLRYGNDPFRHTLLTIPTGLGKTEAVLIPWLYRFAQDPTSVPRRLILVQPRQNLTEQTAKRARDLVEKAGLATRVLQLMGGSEDNDLTLAPDDYAIIVGTQDMVLSGALNRRYARRPPRWPIDFALFNNDALFVFDEVQLASDGLATSTQLAAFRESYGAFGPTPTVWMSATMRPDWLRTVDFSQVVRILELEDDDKKNDLVLKRWRADKSISQAPEQCRTPGGCASFVMAQHKPGERTLIISNTVRRAREIYTEIRKLGCPATLLHSRFRGFERRAKTELLTKEPPLEGQILVSTQVLEAGVDITAHRLVTDVASWGSLVQRFGRVNRYGDVTGAIWWVDQPLSSKKVKDEDLFNPYTTEDARRAAEKLSALTSASPCDLPAEDGGPPYLHVLRKADLMDLFDTSPDISGNELDISRFIRSGEETDCYVAWRSWTGDEELKSQKDASDEELCAVPINDLRPLLSKLAVYAWNFGEKGWTRITDKNRLYPGQILLLEARQGCYTKELGWAPESKAAVEPLESAADDPEGDSDDRLSWTSYKQTLPDHTAMVVAALEELLAAVENLELRPYLADLRLAAAKHDWGKAHDVMQETLKAKDICEELLAKQVKKLAASKHSRRNFRHELASALAMLSVGDSDLAAYLAAAHHGRIRLSIRSMPGEAELTQGVRVARGIHDGDVLRACQLMDGLSVPSVTLKLDVMRLGLQDQGVTAWTDRVIQLLKALGPFRLAYLETLLRTADERASERKGKEVAAAWA